MKRVICDYEPCRKEVAPDSYGLSPEGWLSMSKRGTSYVAKDYCSEACTIKDLGGTVPVEQPAASDSELPVVKAGA